MRSVEERFWSKVEKTEGGCWLWTASDRFRIGRTMNVPHRVAYELSFGKAPDDECVLQRCGNSSCVNPDHLFLGKPLGVRKVSLALPVASASASDLEAENAELRQLLMQARTWFIAGWRHQRPRRYLRFRQEMNKALRIPLDFDY